MLRLPLLMANYLMPILSLEILARELHCEKKNLLSSTYNRLVRLDLSKMLSTLGRAAFTQAYNPSDPYHILINRQRNSSSDLVALITDQHDGKACGLCHPLQYK